MLPPDFVELETQGHTFPWPKSLFWKMYNGQKHKNNDMVFERVVGECYIGVASNFRSLTSTYWHSKGMYMAHL